MLGLFSLQDTAVDRCVLQPFYSLTQALICLAWKGCKKIKTLATIGDKFDTFGSPDYMYCEYAAE